MLKAMLKLNKKAAGKTTVREYNSDFFFFFADS